MLISLNWLKQYVEINENIDELEHALTMIGQEVEAIDIKGEHLDNVVVGHIVEYGLHPDSDKLTLLKVSVGEEQPLQIVCGATNHKEGDKVAVAKIGAVLPGDFKIKKAKVRGVESCGMLGSEKELGIGEDNDGIMILPADAPVGKLLKDYLNINDVVFELEITPNRPDCLSHIGIAREIAAFYKRNLKLPAIKLNEIHEDINDYVNVNIEDKDLCDRYCARVIKNVKIGESPKWLKDRLSAIGIRSINNIVDITNYVMMEYNHPLHAFDLKKVNNKIIVRRAKDGEKIVTLDEVERELDNNDLVIADSNKAIAIAGVMGASNSEVSENTTEVILEVASFNRQSIRMTSKKLALSSDASYRFERGIDATNSYNVINRAASLIQEIAGGDIVAGIADEKLNKLLEKREVSLNMNKLNRFVGKEISSEIVGNILTSLNMEIISHEDNVITITPPTYRQDITRSADLYEEVIRMYGFDNIEAVMPNENISAGEVYSATKIIDYSKNSLVNIGLSEVINYSFIPENALDLIKAPKDMIKIINPISEDMIMMRPTLIYSLLNNVKDNFNRNNNHIKIFEASRVFHISENSTTENFCNEIPYVAFALAGKKEKDLWDVKPKSYDFYDLKAVTEQFLSDQGINRFQIDRTENPIFHPGRAAEIRMGKDVLGYFGEIHPDVAENMSIDKDRVYIAEFDLTKIEKYGNKKFKYEPISKYPAVPRDLAIVVDEDLLVGNMISQISKSDKLIEKVDLFDIYSGENIEDGKKSVALNIVLRSDKETLSEEVVNKSIDNILSLIKKKFNGELRQ